MKVVRKRVRKATSGTSGWHGKEEGRKSLIRIII